MRFLLIVVLLTCTSVLAESRKAHLEYLHTKFGVLIKIVNDSPRTIKCYVRVDGEKKRVYKIRRNSYTLWMDKPKARWSWDCD